MFLQSFWRINGAQFTVHILNNIQFGENQTVCFTKAKINIFWNLFERRSVSEGDCGAKKKALNLFFDLRQLCLLIIHTIPTHNLVYYFSIFRRLCINSAVYALKSLIVHVKMLNYSNMERDKNCFLVFLIQYVPRSKMLPES